jgi:DNA-binding NarL/FixJ family response regulator
MKTVDVGFILLSPSLHPIYTNSQAVQILSYPSHAHQTHAIDKTLSTRIQKIMSGNGSSPQTGSVTEFVSGKRHYLCRALSVSPKPGERSGENVVLLMERAQAISIDLNKTCTKYRLTGREREAVTYLARGLAGKEIAERMKISPNTVKAFFRFAMIKMGVNTRSGIMGKIIQQEH